MAIHLIQCLCPERHCICGICYDTEAVSPDDAMSGFEALFDQAVQEGLLNRRCELCGSRELFFEDGRTVFSTMDEARPVLSLEEAKQLKYREAVLAERARRN